ncbi:hypothetical protein E2C01_041330 [Portunus trituberculatus]|uniref:Uncharacterized protein n=1 Tax=Portunus trituberculatus TaxID=210409 RepID=A0A5B7FQN6_PORTR|nr:hypothetical protein [Portunus trituberculatus]
MFLEMASGVMISAVEPVCKDGVSSRHALHPPRPSAHHHAAHTESSSDRPTATESAATLIRPRAFWSPLRGDGSV